MGSGIDVRSPVGFGAVAQGEGGAGVGGAECLAEFVERTCHGPPRAASGACRYVADEELRRRARRQLNKGESLHALRRDLFFAHQGHVRRRHLDDQVDQALCLTLVTNAAVLWTTTYLGDALDTLRADGDPSQTRTRHT